MVRTLAVAGCAGLLGTALITTSVSVRQETVPYLVLITVGTLLTACAASAVLVCARVIAKEWTEP